MEITNTEERIAEEVRKYPHLFNTSIKDYKDARMTANSWRSISAAVELDPKDCAKRWRSLWDKFVRAKRTFKSKWRCRREEDACHPNVSVVVGPVRQTSGDVL